MANLFNPYIYAKIFSILFTRWLYIFCCYTVWSNAINVLTTLIISYLSACWHRMFGSSLGSFFHHFEVDRPKSQEIAAIQFCCWSRFTTHFSLFSACLVCCVMLIAKIYSERKKPIERDKEKECNSESTEVHISMDSRHRLTLSSWI